MSATKVPYEHPNFDEEGSQLVTELVSLSKKSPKLVKSSEYPAPGEPHVMIRSWKMNEFKYYDIPSPFPTYARGLFTVELPRESDEEGIESEHIEHDSHQHPRYRIVVRGYDKFFNIGEVPWTEWEFMEHHTRPPYTLSLKSNGCIVFIAAFTPSKLIVTSKHSLGPVEGLPLSHAQAAEKWLEHYLEQKQRTEADLAKQLWDNNWTAIAELCDDSFEEHVLPYTPERAGLYLHGLNTCTREFHTLSPDTVDAFAEEWGFIKTRYTILDSISSVRKFTDDIRHTGAWEGEPVEGFVVRTHVTEPPLSSSGATQPTTTGTKKGNLPYNPGSTFFFKVKFDEPYMMYRDWREVTKILLSKRAKTGHLNASDLPNSKMRRPETRTYVNWVIKEIKTSPHEFDDYTKGKGIIRTRERFLEWLASDEGKEKVIDAADCLKEEEQQFKSECKTIIVPVAIPGCGKTAVSVALAHIFGFSHTQSDDVRVKKPGPAFVRDVMHLLQTHRVVIADKNNHLRQHREVLRKESISALNKARNKRRAKKQKGKKAADDLPDEEDTEFEPPTQVRLVALYWPVADLPSPTVFRVCADRVRSRGENHQTLRTVPSAPPASSSNASWTSDGTETYENIIWNFIREMEDLSPSEVDGIVEMVIDEPLEASIQRAVAGIVKELGIPMPSEEKVKEGLEKAKSYTVPEANKRPDQLEAATAIEDKPVGRKPPRYYGLVPEIYLGGFLDPVFAFASPDAASFWAKLKNNALLTSRPHVTIVHTKELPNSTELWDRCSSLISYQDEHGIEAVFHLRLGHVLWNDRIMAITVEDVRAVGDVQEGQDWADWFASNLPDTIRERLHITVGTRDLTIPPFEAMSMVIQWRKGERDEKTRVIQLSEE
ncbi:hypothetical protein AX17_003621, partial [Amanita inopinata Kibby_2008]